MIRSGSPWIVWLKAFEISLPQCYRDSLKPYWLTWLTDKVQQVHVSFFIFFSLKEELIQRVVCSLIKRVWVVVVTLLFFFFHVPKRLLISACWENFQTFKTEVRIERLCCIITAKLQRPSHPRCVLFAWRICWGKKKKLELPIGPEFFSAGMRIWCCKQCQPPIFQVKVDFSEFSHCVQTRRPIMMVVRNRQTSRVLNWWSQRKKYRISVGPVR